MVAAVATGHLPASGEQATEDKGARKKDPSLLFLPSLRQESSDWQQMLTSLGALYVQGAPIDWPSFDHDYQRRKVTLPTYPFQRQRYWVESNPSRPSSTVLSPLLDKMVQLPATQETLFETAMSAATLPFLRDHRVDQSIVAPGACHLAMVLNAAALALTPKTTDGQLLHLVDVIFPQPLALGDDETLTVQILLTPTHTDDQEPTARFQLLSFAPVTGATPVTTLHAQGRVRATAKAATAPLSLSALQERCHTTAELDTLLAADTSRFVFGTTFCWLEAAWHAPSHAGEVFTRLRRPATLTSLEGYPIHPGLLDACFQTPGLVPSFASRTGELWLPFAVAALRVEALPSPTAESWWCHTEQIDEQTWNIRLLDEQGQLLIVIEGFQLRATGPTTIGSPTLRTNWLQSMTWQAMPLPPATTPLALPACWLLVGQADEVGTALAATARPIYLLTSRTALHATLAEIADTQQSVGVIYLGYPTPVTDTPLDAPMQALQLCSDLLQLTQALLTTALAAQLWVVTPGCQQPIPTMPITAVAAGALWGLGRTIAQEQPQIRCVCLDLDPTAATWTQQLVDEIVDGWGRATVDPQVAYADGTRYVATLTPWQPPVAPTQNQPMRLQLQAYGALDQLTFVPLTRRPPAAGEIEIEVKAVGLNFRDVLNTLGLLQEYYATVLDIANAQEVGLGFECAGVIRAVGDGVPQFAVGDRVMGLASGEGAFASYLTVPAVQMTPTPAAVSDLEAATFPMAFLTAWYGLVEQADLQAGEWVLIHAASGGVGQAALQIAHALGAQVIATASPGKWAWLQQQGVAHLLNSRTLAFADEVMALTAGAGVAVVLNSLNGDFIERSFAALGHGGRFVEIGKLGIWTPEQVAAQRPDAHYCPFDLGEVLTADPTLYARLWHAIATRVQTDTFRPLPQTVFPVTETVAAFRYMQQAKQIGKIVVDFTRPAPVLLDAQATYLVTGGLGALGLQVAQQLVAAGARQLVLTGRQGVTSDAQQQALAALATAGANVVVVPTDIADRTAAAALIDRCTTLAPLRGIVHAAGVLEDGMLTTQTPTRLANVMRPKVEGTWHLHTLTTALELDFFICFSSAAALLGSAGQSSYAAANAFMDTLMQQRRQQGLPGLSVNWGPWADIGMAAGLQTKMAAQGLTMISAQQGRQLFHYLLERVGQIAGQIAVLPLLHPSVPEQTARKYTTPHALSADLLALPSHERVHWLEKYLRREIAAVLGLPANGTLDTGTLDTRTRLFDVGMDSLMAVELKNRIEAGLRCSVRATLLFDYPTLEVLVPHLLESVLKLAEGQASSTGPADLNSPASSKGTTHAAPPATSLETLRSTPIAIIGLACHYPGGVDTPAAFWQQLVAGFDGIVDLPQKRAVDLGLTTPTNANAYALRGGFLDQVDGFDPAFFGLSPREVVVMDPAHRLLLETAWQALEDACLIPAQLFNQEIGVFVGGGLSGYLPAGAEQSNMYAATGNTASTAAGRISYLFGFTGPAMAVDTACSSSLVAVHLACQSLRNHECDAALAGGVNLILDQETTTMFAGGTLLSSDARCKTFDAAANGYVRGEGCGLLVLKRLADAEADGDRIVAVIRGTAVNQDGPSSGLTVPNGPAQERVIRRALADAGVEPAQVSYVEAHGTGTPLGDPIEIGALSAVFQERTTPLYVGSVKTNIGHLEAAAGIAGLMKLVLALYHRQIPPHLHLQTPNPYIDWAAIPVKVPTVLTDWSCPTDAETRIGGVSSFGFSGTNAHVIVEEAPPCPAQSLEREGTGFDVSGSTALAEVSTQHSWQERSHHLLTITTKSADALQAYAECYLALLRAQPALNWGDLCHAAQTGRSHFAHRLGLVATSVEDLCSQLLAYTTDTPRETLSQGHVGANQAPPKIAFLFTGQGAQYLYMGRDLYATAPVFRAVIDRCAVVMQEALGRSLLDLLYPATVPTQNDLLDSHPCGQAVNFALECALADLWRAWGIQPAAVLGHSLGDFAAAYTAGVLELEEGLRLVIERGQLMEQALGSMVSVMAAETEVAPFLTGLPDVTIAVINGPQSVVISGGEESVATVAEQLNAAGFKTRTLDIPVAAHSPMLDPVLADFAAALQHVKLTLPQLPVVSSMTGKMVTVELTETAYWCQHLRNTVRFADGVMTLLAQGIEFFIEIGPKPVLSGIAQAIVDGKAAAQQSPLFLPSLRENQPDWRQMLTSLSALYVRGVAINWAGVDQGRPQTPGRRPTVALPTYPFQRQRYWYALSTGVAQGVAQGSARQARLHPLLDKMTQVPRHQETIFETAFSVETLPFLADHCVYGAVISPGACQLALVVSAADLLLDRDDLGICLENVILPQPLVLPAGTSRTVQTILSGRSGKNRGEKATQYDFEVLSFGSAESDAEPASHATGLVTTCAPGASRESATLSLDNLRQRCAQAVEVETFYRTMSAAQIELGPSFQWVEAAWRGAPETPEALARLVLPPAVVSQTDLLLHPGLLDACFQMAGLASASEQDEKTRLPFAVERLSLSMAHPMQHDAWWCHARQQSAHTWEMHLLDEQGHLLLHIEGYEVRTAAAETVRGADLWRDWLYQLKWQPHPYFGLRPDYLPPPAAVAPSLRAQLPALWQAAGGEQAQALQPHLDQLSLAYVLAAFTNTGFTFHPGAQWPTEQLAQQLGVIPSYQRLFHRLLTMLAEAGILRQEQNHWTVLRLPEERERITTLESAPPWAAQAPECQLLMRCGPQLSAVLRGTQEPLALLFPDGDDTITAKLYSTSPGTQVMNTLIAHLVQQAVDQLPTERGMRILEIGAGTGGTTAGLLPRLPSNRTDYCFTDIGPTFLAQAQTRFADYPFVRYQPLDIEREPAVQGFAKQQVDVVVAANVLHATQDLAVTLAHVQTLLHPGGTLILLETTSPSRWIELTFGLTDGWWRFADARQEQPLLSADQWQQLLQSAGFPAVEILEQEGQAVIIAQAATSTSAVAARTETLPAESAKVWLIFADAQGVGDTLADQLQQRGEHTQLVYRGEAYGVVDAQRLQLQPERAADYQQLLATYPAPQGIVYLWGLDTPQPRQAAVAETNLVANIQIGCSPALHLAQTLLQAGTTSTRLWLVTQGVQTVTAGDRADGYSQAPLWGLGRVLAQEYPELPCVCVDLAWSAGTPAQLAAQLCAELHNRKEPAAQMALRPEARYVVRLTRFTPAPRPNLRCDPAATYLIAGGLGGIGLATAAWLATQGARQLLLVSRSHPQPAAQATLDALMAQGVTVTVAQCDVTERAQVEQLLTRIDADHPLRGIIHSVGVLDDGALLQQSWERFAKVLAPKVQGIWHLHTLTSAMTLDFFVLYSSAAGLLGSRGQANHAAANAFLDAFAHYRQAQQQPALSINWGAWAEIGSAAQFVRQHSSAARGYRAIPPELGIAALAGLLSQPTPQVGVIPFDWRTFQPETAAERAFYAEFFAQLSEASTAAPTVAPTAAGSQPSIREQLATVAPQAAEALLTAYLQQEVAQILQMAGLPNPTSGFHEIGMDSLMTIELRRRLEKGLAVALPSTIVFEYPTVALLRQYLVQEVFHLSAPAASLPPNTQQTVLETAADQSTHDTEPVNADLNALSDTELNALLAQELAMLKE
jgi:acyl transferase domain-containing protein/ubiquinone/menaquinone biosynthesis C-methylase UbiE/acyl carrier protein